MVGEIGGLEVVGFTCRPAGAVDARTGDRLTACAQLLSDHRVDAGEIALITHQGSRTLLDHWAEAVRPAQHLETFAELGNMTSATYPVSLAYHWDQVEAPYVVIVSVGTGFHLTAILLRRHCPD